MATNDPKLILEICAAHGLTERQSRFVSIYLASGNGTAAYREAYATKATASARWVREEASRLRRHPKIAAVISELEQKRIGEANKNATTARARLIKKLVSIASANIADFGYVDENGQFVVDLTGCTREQLAAVKITTRETTDAKGKVVGRTTKITMPDKIAALVAIGKHFGMFTKRSS